LIAIAERAGFGDFRLFRRPGGTNSGFTTAAKGTAFDYEGTQARILIDTIENKLYNE